MLMKYTRRDDDGDDIVVEFTIRPCGCSANNCNDDTIRIIGTWDDSESQADVPADFGSLLRCLLGEADY